MMVKMKKGIGPAIAVLGIALLLIVLAVAFVAGSMFGRRHAEEKYLFEATLISQSDKVETYVRSFQRATDLSFLQAIYDYGTGSIVLPYDFNTYYSQKYNLPYWQIYDPQIPPEEIMKNKFRQKISWVSSCYLDNYYDAYQDFAENSGFDMTFVGVPLLNVMEFTDNEISVGKVEDMIFRKSSTVDDQTIDITRAFKPYSELETKFVNMIGVAENMINNDILGQCIRNETTICLQDDYTREKANEALTSLANNLQVKTCMGVGTEDCSIYSGDNDGDGDVDFWDEMSCAVRGCPTDGLPNNICSGTVHCSYYSSEASCNANGCIWGSVVKIELKIPEDVPEDEVYKKTGPRAIVNVSIYEDNRNYSFYYPPDDEVKLGFIGVNFLAKVGVSGDNWDEVPITSLAFHDCDVGSGYSGLGIISPKDTDDICKFFKVTPTEACQDTDGGSDYTTAGTCTDFTGSYDDICIDNTLYEYYCFGGYEICHYNKYDCTSEGKICEDGACVVAPPTCVPCGGDPDGDPVCNSVTGLCDANCNGGLDAGLLILECDGKTPDSCPGDYSCGWKGGHKYYGVNPDCARLWSDGNDVKSCEDTCGFVWVGNGGNLNCCGDDPGEASPYESPEVSCADGNDNDCDGLPDCADPDCIGQIGPGGQTCCASASDCTQDDCVIESCEASKECAYTDRPAGDTTECDICEECNAAGGDCLGITADNGKDCNNDCDSCANGNCDVRLEDDNTEVITTCYYCDGVEATSQPYSGETGIGCTDDCNTCIIGVCTDRAACDDTECSSGEYCDSAGGDCKGLEEDSYVCSSCFSYHWTGNGGNLNCCGNDALEDSPYEMTEVSCSDLNDNDCDGLIDSGPACLYRLRVNAQVDITQLQLSNVQVTVGGLTKTTDSSGVTEFMLTPGIHTITVGNDGQRPFSHFWDHDCNKNNLGYYLDTASNPYTFEMFNRDRGITAQYETFTKITDFDHDGATISGKLLDEDDNAPILGPGNYHPVCEDPSTINEVPVDKDVVLEYSTDDGMRWEPIGSVESSTVDGSWSHSWSCVLGTDKLRASYNPTNWYYESTSPIIDIDCPSFCGDGYCDSGENCENCPSDCRCPFGELCCPDGTCASACPL